jgi:hypothetical protein
MGCAALHRLYILIKTTFARHIPTGAHRQHAGERRIWQQP